MTITLTREEAQQVLDALSDCREDSEERFYDYKQKYGDHYKPQRITFQQSVLDQSAQAIETLRARLSAPEPVRLRRGDILRCIETNELCTVWATSTTGKTLIKWKANDFGEYTAEQIGDLFLVEPKPEPEPVAWEYCGALFHDKKEVFAWHERGDISNTPPRPLYTALPQRKPWDNKVLITDEYERGVIDGMQKQMQSSVDKAVNKMAKREWQGLTDEEILEEYRQSYGDDGDLTDVYFARAIEAKLKEKNT
jgi:hypothetical protein